MTKEQAKSLSRLICAVVDYYKLDTTSTEITPEARVRAQQRGQDNITTAILEVDAQKALD